VIKKLEVLTNIAVIATSLVVCTVLIKRYLIPSKTQAAITSSTSGSAPSLAPHQSSIVPGTRVSLPSIDWSKSDHTILLALSTTCHFCSESAPFYQKLAQAKRADVRLVAVFPQSIQDGSAYLQKLGVAVDEVAQSPLSAVGVSATPTLILVGTDGAIVDSWVGKLPANVAEEVTSRVSK